ncbi:DNA-binding transcriptional regulator, LysR family [Aeromicrobium sp. 9AM]|nr:DNA-binding transcriptional regulator, LysR family [Aeromicrobium sp. 9AM]
MQGLRILIAIQDTKSVTAAATELGYTAPNVTQHLRRLERKLNSPMVERVGRGIVLTERARNLADIGRPLLLQLDDLAARSVDEPVGAMDVAAFPTAVRGIAIPVLSTLARSHPDLHVRVRELGPEEALEAVRRGDIQAAVTKTWGPGRQPTIEGVLERIPLGVDRVDAILPASHPLAAKSSLTLHDLADEPWAVTPVGDPYRTWLTGHRLSSQIDPTILHEASEYASLIAYVRDGLAVAAVPRLGRGELPPDVMALPLSDESAMRRVFLVVRRSSRGGPGLEAVVDEMVSAGRATLT